MRQSQIRLLGNVQLTSCFVGVALVIIVQARLRLVVLPDLSEGLTPRVPVLKMVGLNVVDKVLIDCLRAVALRLVYSIISGDKRCSVWLPEHDVRLLCSDVVQGDPRRLVEGRLASDGVVSRGVLISIATCADVEICSVRLSRAALLGLPSPLESLADASAMRSLTVVGRGVLAHDEVGGSECEHLLLPGRSSYELTSVGRGHATFKSDVCHLFQFLSVIIK